MGQPDTTGTACEASLAPRPRTAHTRGTRREVRRVGPLEGQPQAPGCWLNCPLNRREAHLVLLLGPPRDRQPRTQSPQPPDLGPRSPVCNAASLKLPSPARRARAWDTRLLSKEVCRDGLQAPTLSATQVPVNVTVGQQERGRELALKAMLWSPSVKLWRDLIWRNCPLIREPFGFPCL